MIWKWEAVLAAAMCVSGFAASPALADTITIFNSGVDGTGHVLSPGSADPHWSLASVPAGSSFSAPGSAIVETPHPAYIPSSAVGALGSAWIGPQSAADAPLPPGAYIYQTQFDLTGLSASTAQLSGRIASDNSLDSVKLNGVSLGITGGGFTSWLTTFSITSGFVGGVNTLEFLIANHDALGGPTGFRIEIAGTAQPVPLPSAALGGTLLLGALAGFSLVRRRSPNASPDTGLPRPRTR